HNQHVEAEHLLLALFEDPEGMAPAIALKVGADAQKIQRELKQSVQDVPKVSGSGAGQLYVGDSLRKLYDKAEAAATKLNDQYISAEHFLMVAPELGGKLADLFKRNGLTSDALLKAIKEVRGNQQIHEQDPDAKFRALEKYCIDLTQRASNGKL